MTENSFPHHLTVGSSHPRLPVLKDQLRRAGYEVPAAEDETVFDHAFYSVLRQFQQQRGLLADGVLGPETLMHIEYSRYRLGDRVLRFDPVRPLRGDDVAELQARLRRLGMYPHVIDSVFGHGTDAALRELQRDLGLQADGVCGPATLRGFAQISKDVGGGNLFALSEKARVSRAGSSLAGKRVFLEADTLGTSGPRPDSPALDIARRLDRRFSAIGTTCILRDVGQTDPRLPDKLGADVVISISTDQNSSPHASGLATFYYGSADEAPDVSPVGAALAKTIHREILARTDLHDCWSHARTWESLRELSTPKVHVVAGYETSVYDSRRLENPAFRDVVAEAILVGVQRLYLPDHAEPQTGVMSIDHIMASRHVS